MAAAHKDKQEVINYLEALIKVHTLLDTNDVTLEDRAFIVVYNNVAQYLPLNVRGEAVAQLIRLSQKYVTFALAPQDGATKVSLKMHGFNPPLGSSFVGFGEKNKETTNSLIY